MKEPNTDSTVMMGKSWPGRKAGRRSREVSGRGSEREARMTRAASYTSHGQPAFATFLWPPTPPRHAPHRATCARSASQPPCPTHSPRLTRPLVQHKRHADASQQQRPDLRLHLALADGAYGVRRRAGRWQGMWLGHVAVEACSAVRGKSRLAGGWRQGSPGRQEGGRGSRRLCPSAPASHPRGWGGRAR